MKRWIGIVAATVWAASAFSQAPFTIVRPANDAKVKEVVKVLLPKNSVPEDGFVGVYVDGKFIEATTLAEKGEYSEYALDTKARRITDGRHKLEFVLYSGTDRPKVMDRTSVDVTVANSASIKMPEDGFTLRYKWKNGQKLVYNVEAKGTVNTISEQQARAGGRSAELPLDADHFRYQYAVDNTYGNGDGLLRLTPMALKGRDTVFFRLLQGVDGSVKQGQLVQDGDFGSIYQRLSDTGVEQFGTIPIFVNPFGGSGGKGNEYILIPMPILPTDPIKPGTPFPGFFQLPEIDLAKQFELNNTTVKLKARGEFVGAEWESGHPCAKLRYIITAEPIKAKAGASKEGMGGEKMSLEQTVYFAMDMGVPIRVEIDQTLDTQGQISAGGPSGPAGGGNPAGGRGPGRKGGPDDEGGGLLLAQSGQGGGRGGFGPPPGQFGPPAGSGPPGGRFGGPPGAGGPPQGGAPQGRAGGGMAGGNQLLRLRIKLTMILEQ